jgi:thiaminase/transcriptional activator TenA
MIFDKMRLATHSVMNEIFAQPFNHELCNGTLPRQKFISYLQQDALYLADYSRALALTAARLSCDHQYRLFLQFALDAIKAEQDLHSSYLKQQQHSVSMRVEQNPACFMYTNYLLKMASTASVEESVASLLPCFWVYQQVGSKIAKMRTSSNPYDNWIELYSGEKFYSSVEIAIKVTNDLSQIASSEIKEKMITAFVRSTQLEWYFWDNAYRQEKWALF